MDDKQRELLENHNVIILPDNINHDFYSFMVEAVIMYPDNEINMYCRGDGGSTRSAVAIVDLIKQHGNFTGLLAGEANSSHVTVWAGCTRRYVYPNAAIGVHKISWDLDNIIVTSEVAKTLMDDYEVSERIVSDILAGASNKDAQFWYDAQQFGNTAYKMKMFYYQDIIAMEMALPIGERMITSSFIANGHIGDVHIIKASDPLNDFFNNNDSR